MPVVVYVTISKRFLERQKEVIFLAIQCIYLRFESCLQGPIKRTAGVPKFDPEVDPQTNANLVNVSS